MNTFEDMIKMAKRAKSPQEVNDRLEAAIANLPSRFQVAAENSNRRRTEAQILGLRWRRAGLAIAGVAACAVLSFCLVGMPALRGGYGNGPDAAMSGQAVARNAFSVQQAYASEVDAVQNTHSSTFALANQGWGQIDEWGCWSGLVFKVEGENIAHIKASISEGQLYRTVRTELSPLELQNLLRSEDLTEGEGFVHIIECYGDDLDTKDGGRDDYCEVVGATVDEEWDSQVAYGFYQPARVAQSFVQDDPSGPLCQLFDSFDGAVLEVEVTYNDGSNEKKTYDLQSGKLKLVFSEEGEGVQLTGDFAESDDDMYIYGVLAKERQ